MEDGCNAATPVSIHSITQGSTVGSPLYESERCQIGAPPRIAAGAWFSVTGDGGEVTAAFCNSEFDTVVRVKNANLLVERILLT